MSDTQNTNIRILLGPVARALIAGIEENRPTALDEAITKLIEERDDALAAKAQPPEQASEAGSAQDVAKALTDLTRAIQEQKEITLAEMKMTRLLVAVMMKQGEGDNVALRELTGKVVQKITDQSTTLDANTRDWLRDLERKYQDAERQDLERVGLLQKPWKEPELAR